MSPPINRLPVFNPTTGELYKKMGRACIRSTIIKGQPPVVVGNCARGQALWACSLGLDSGRLGEPAITLVVKIAKDKTLVKMEGNTPSHEVIFKWRPGSVTDGLRCMIDDFDFSCINDDRANPQHQDVLDQFATTDEISLRYKLEHVFHMGFTSGGAIPYNADPALWSHLPPDVRGTLDLLTSGSQVMCLYLYATHTSKEEVTSGWLQPLKSQINSHIKPWHFYREPDGSIDLDIHKMPKIAEVGHGALVRQYHKGFTTAFHTHPRRAYFDSIDEFTLSMGMPSVRRAQWEMEQTSQLEHDTYYMFLQHMSPMLKLSGGLNVSKPLSDKFYGFLRLNIARGAVSSTLLHSGTQVGLEFANPLGAKPDIAVQRSERWTGTIVDNDFGCSETDTAFCVMLTKPEGFDLSRFEPRIHDKPFRQPSDRLIEVRFSTIFDATSVNRELTAVSKLGDASWKPAKMGPIRTAMLSSPNKLPKHVQDLTAGKREIWIKLQKYNKAVKKFNPEQCAVIDALEHVMDRIMAIDGPPGTGKTVIITQIVLALLLLGYKLMCVGPSNVAVDNLAARVYKELKDNGVNSITSRVSSELKDKKLFRLEVSGSELFAMNKAKDYASLAEANPQEPLEYMSDDQFDAFEDAVRATTLEYVEHYADASEILSQTKALLTQAARVKEAIKQVATYKARRRSGVALEMSMAWHLCQQSLADTKQAETNFEAVKAAWLSDGMDDDTVKKAVHTGTMTKEVGLAYLKPKTTLQDFEAMVMQGHVDSQKQRDRSRKWRHYLQLYRQKNGRLTGEDRKSFMVAWAGVVARLLNGIHVLFTTCNNAGSELLATGFSPNVVLCDEAAQTQFASLAIPMTQAGEWDVLIIAGDIQQLNPMDPAKSVNEFSPQANMSCLELFGKKDWNIHRVWTQYRMAPSISQFPSRRFYQGMLKDAPSTKQDNQWRRAFRDVSKRCYNINPRQKKDEGGSEYFVINCQNGLSQVHSNSTSLANSAFSAATIELIQNLMEVHVPVSDITVLTYYSGQKVLTSTKLRQIARHGAEDQWETDEIEVRTVDSYQGAESHIVILDMVVGTFGLTPTKSSKAKAAAKGRDVEMRDVGDMSDTDADDDSQSHQAVTTVLSTHLRNAGRLCTAVTRTQDGLAVVLRASTIVSHKARLSEERATLTDFYFDALDRKLVYHDSKGYEWTPEYTQLTGGWDEAKKAQHDREYDHQRKAYLNKAEQTYHNHRGLRIGSIQPDETGLMTPQYHHAGSSSLSATPDVMFDPANPEHFSNRVSVTVREGKPKAKGRQKVPATVEEAVDPASVGPWQKRKDPFGFGEK